jgi:integrase
MKYIFESNLKPYIIGLIQQKRADGFSYDTDEYHFKKLDDFCLAFYPDATTITRELASEWAVIRPTEGGRYRNRRVSTLRQLSLYILSHGCESYVPRNNAKESKPVLYVPSHEEISAFLSKIDSWEPHNYCGRRTANEYKLIFRLYYCCGMRLSEARLLKKSDVDFDKGILAIYKSKGHKDRLVYLPPDGRQMLNDYRRYIEKAAPLSPWLFPGHNTGNPLSADAIRLRFHDCWNSLPFSAKADKRPTPHCLRHAFVVERLNDWMQRGLDTQELLPYLSKYLGHKTPSETFYYYHLVDNAFSAIKEKDTISGRVIPEVYVYEEI